MFTCQIGSSPGFEDGEFESAKLVRPAASFYNAAEDCLYFVDSEVWIWNLLSSELFNDRFWIETLKFDALGIKTDVREDWGYYFDKNHILRHRKVCWITILWEPAFQNFVWLC